VLAVALTLVLVFWNPRGLTNKATEFKGYLGELDAAYAGISESQTYKDGLTLSDGEWRWDAGAEGRPTEKGGGGVARGIGALVNTNLTQASVIRTGKYTLWHRLELEGGGKPLAVGTGYFPKAQDVKGHVAANKELSADFACLIELGYRMVFGGDLNAHIGANGDATPVDAAGRMLLETLDWAGMVMVNTMPGKCTGGPSRVQVLKDGQQESTIDYAVCSADLTPHVRGMRITDRQMGSDHRILVLTLSNLGLKAPVVQGMREVWKIDSIPSPPDDWSWVGASRARFQRWLSHTTSLVQTATATGSDASTMGNLLDWSFQLALDEVAAEQLGTKWVGPKGPAILSAAGRAAVEQRELCQDVMKWVMKDSSASEEVRREARVQFLAASRSVLAVAEQTRRIAEVRLFRDVESKQGDSKEFWGKFRAVRNSIVVNKSPPPVATNADGVTVTDPIAVLKAWRDFSASIASTDFAGTTEEGIYDEEHRVEVESNLAWLRLVRVHQPELDRPFTAQEVFVAIRKLRMGSAPGEDGILADIIKTAADAVNNSKLRAGNTVVDAMTLLFNFMFTNEVWPERWSTGVITPLFKDGSRLDPSNYRPITLLSIMGKLFGSVVNARLAAFSEATDSISDEQGGFRRARGTPDQILILREVLASRKERGQSTYATYIDARKAYDTVWREQAYSRVHASGVQGKLWRQLQNMHGNLTRRVRHPLGLTDPFDVKRGVAQGAVESPWLYSNFIDGLARELKAAGLGIWIAGRQVPLLMYADDIILLARSEAELTHMNSVVSAFAQRNRFQFNGSKSAVMVFNVTAVEKARCKAGHWELFGETVLVKDTYVYLGTVVPEDDASWKDHVDAAIAKAQRRSADLLWVCRGDKGIRSRTAVTLWQSLVRPLLEYAAELWGGAISKDQEQRAELVQTTFLRGTLGLHRNGSGVSNHVVRAETGCERLRDRWAKLQLGYWRRVFVAPANRLLRVVVSFRHKERRMSGGVFGRRGWLPQVERTLTRVGMHRYWLGPTATALLPAGAWRDKVYKAVDSASDKTRAIEMLEQRSSRLYTEVKEWGVNPSEYSFSVGETDRLGQHVPERYLDDRDDLKGTRLKMLSRMGCLPLMNRVGREQRPAWPKERRVCLACNICELEDVAHFVLRCPAYAHHRQRMLADIVSVALKMSSAGVGAGDGGDDGEGGVGDGGGGGGDDGADDGSAVGGGSGSGGGGGGCGDGGGGGRPLLTLSDMQGPECLPIILGKRIGVPRLENRIDRATKRYLRKAWNTRGRLTRAINATLGTNYDVFTAAAR
jgi:hypothetical protein